MISFILGPFEEGHRTVSWWCGSLDWIGSDLRTDWYTGIDVDFSYPKWCVSLCSVSKPYSVLCKNAGCPLSLWNSHPHPAGEGAGRCPPEILNNVGALHFRLGNLGEAKVGKQKCSFFSMLDQAAGTGYCSAVSNNNAFLPHRNTSWRHWTVQRQRPSMMNTITTPSPLPRPTI